MPPTPTCASRRRGCSEARALAGRGRCRTGCRASPRRRRRPRQRDRLPDRQLRDASPAASTGSSTSSAARAAPANRRPRRCRPARPACWPRSAWSAPRWPRSTSRCARCSSGWWWRRSRSSTSASRSASSSARADLGRGTPLDVARANALVESTEATHPRAAGRDRAQRAAHRHAEPAARRAPRCAQLAETEAAAQPAGDERRGARRRHAARPARAPAGHPRRRTAARRGHGGRGRRARRPLPAHQPGRRCSASPARARRPVRQRRAQHQPRRQPDAGRALDFGRVRNRIGASEARAQRRWCSGSRRVQLALEETEGALSQYTRSVQQAARLENAARESAEAARLARVRYEAGAADFLTVLDAERSAARGARRAGAGAAGQPDRAGGGVPRARRRLGAAVLMRNRVHRLANGLAAFASAALLGCGRSRPLAQRTAATSPLRARAPG